MGFPGMLPTPPLTPAGGLACPSPELRELFWVEDVATAQPRSRYIFTGLNPTIRTDEALGGTAEVSAVVDANGLPGLQAELVLEGVWDVVLLDSFDDDICPGFSPDDPYSERTPFFLGEGSRPLLLSRGHLEKGEILEGFLRPNPIAPEGVGVSCLFQNLYVAVETWTGGWMKITPVINGDVLTDEAMAFAIPYSDTGRNLLRLEIPLTREYEVAAAEVSRAGIVGTWFTVEIEFLDAWGCGRMEVGGLEAEYVALEYDTLGLAFTGEVLPDPTRTSRTTWFMGKASALIRGARGPHDVTTDIPIRMLSNDVAPAGAGGECLWEVVYFAVTRNNQNDFDLDLTPFFDGGAGETVTLSFVGGSGEMVTELVALYLDQPYLVDGTEVSRYGPRSAWFQLLVESTEAPDGIFELDGFELEHTVEEESLEAVTND